DAEKSVAGRSAWARKTPTRATASAAEPKIQSKIQSTLCSLDSYSFPSVRDPPGGGDPRAATVIHPRRGAGGKCEGRRDPLRRLRRARPVVQRPRRETAVDVAEPVRFCDLARCPGAPGARQDVRIRRERRSRAAGEALRLRAVEV